VALQEVKHPNKLDLIVLWWDGLDVGYKLLVFVVVLVVIGLVIYRLFNISGSAVISSVIMILLLGQMIRLLFKR
jgi:hypothetical protein